MKYISLFSCIVFLLPINTFAQNSSLSIEKIMRDPKWIGTSPKSLYWANNGRLYFNWNPEQSEDDSLFFISINDHIPVKLPYHLRDKHISKDVIRYNSSGTSYCYNKNGDIIYVKKLGIEPLQVTNTIEYENLLCFTDNDSSLAYISDNNIFLWDLHTGSTLQFSDIKPGKKPQEKEEKKPDSREVILKAEQLRLFPNLKENVDKRKKVQDKKLKKSDKLPFSYYLNDNRLNQLRISPDGAVVTIISSIKEKEGVKTIVPDFVTESGYTLDIQSREKVGEDLHQNQMSFYSLELDSVFSMDLSDLPGIRKHPEFYNDYPAKRDSLIRKNSPRPSIIHEPKWAPTGHHAIIQVYSVDNKDRWICLFDGKNKVLKVLDHQHDEAWIGGPLCGSVYSQGYVTWINADDICFVSEKSGYSHLYLYSVKNNTSKQLTSGNYEIQEATLSYDKKNFYLVTNESHPGAQTIVRLDINNFKKEIITDEGTGLEDVSFSYDGKWVAYLESSLNIPWELYIQENKPNGKKFKITNKARSDEFLVYPWRKPEVVKIKVRDGTEIYSRVYKPSHQDPLKPAVIFVHGAGYLQNAHLWWSTYYREYMFHNLLTDLGYVVLDMDYRASKGYGRNIRTGIYRHMGGKDLDDQIDGAKYLAENYGVDPKRIGIYGGSYGGFITFMALFTHPNVFKAGAALRPVTDWLHFNHGYTAAILNTPSEDSIAYARSSPINFVEGFVNRLLICHGMIDTNVHFQDVVRLQQRLIDLGKDNWEVAAYPMEGHAFKYPASWIDEYKRIFRLFEEELRDKY